MQVDILCNKVMQQNLQNAGCEVGKNFLLPQPVSLWVPALEMSGRSATQVSLVKKFTAGKEENSRGRARF
jgi:hypothetical protein